MLKDTIRCEKDETNLAGYNYYYWNFWRRLIENRYQNDDIEMIKGCLCYFYIDWLTQYDINIDINTIIANAATVTDEQILSCRSVVIVPDFRSFPEYDPANMSIEDMEKYVLEWIFHTSPEVIRNIIDYISPDMETMETRLSRLAASMHTYYISMKFLSFGKKDKKMIESSQFSLSDLLKTIKDIKNRDENNNE